WRDMEVFTEIIHAGTTFASAEDDPATPGCEGISGLPLDADGNLAITVRVTHFGPIISDNQITADCRFVGLTEAEGDDPLALRWTGLEPGDLLGAIIALDSATDWESFRAALGGWDWPSQNFVYADVEGNIGYQAPGKMPLRAADHTGQVPVPGWTDAYEWQGYIPYDLLPRIFNPERGWIVTANNAAAPPEYYATLEDALGPGVNAVYEREWAEGYRAARIEEMVAAAGAHTVQTLAAIQGDAHSIVAEELLPALLDLELEDESLAEAVRWLAGWDLQARAESPQAALFEAFWAALVDRVWADTLGYPGGGAWATQRLLADPTNAWWDDSRTPATETRDMILTLALEDALTTLSERLGPERESWRWGDLHTATFVSSPLGQSGIAAVEGLVNAGPVPASGSSRTVNATSWSPAAPFAVRALPSFRMIVDLGDFEASLGVHTTGQSGHPFSPHYADMIEAWRTINYYPLHFGEEAVRAAAASTQTLRPAAQSLRPAAQTLRQE
ncbi:MAG: penicillin acylase family protein, partial [Anaerolineae bacterium]|nr:penicillin acylase family protein [Anaerolineae bacterium]